MTRKRMVLAQCQSVSKLKQNVWLLIKKNCSLLVIRLTSSDVISLQKADDNAFAVKMKFIEGLLVNGLQRNKQKTYGIVGLL